MSALFIILVSLTMTLFSEKVLIFNRCISGLMSNLIKKSWTDFIWEPYTNESQMLIFFSVLIMSLSFIQIQNEIASLYINQLSRQIEISLIACQCTFICQRLYIISFFLMERNQKNLVTTKSSNYVLRFQGPVCVKKKLQATTIFIWL